MRFLLFFCMLLLPMTAAATQYVILETSAGSIKLELDDQRSPETVKNFLAYADAGFYDGTIFHRVIDSATSQFFINLQDNDFLDHQGDGPANFGYAVFGRVVTGMDVVDAIGKLKTSRKNALFQNLPVEMVIIRKIRRVAE
jgi:cyclophilin family peptidyl-prolyl cis-trans isomerase